VKKILRSEDGEPPAVVRILSMIFAYRTSIGKLKVRQIKYGKV